MRRLSLGELFLLLCLVGMLIASIVWSASVWDMTGSMDVHTWIALGLGTFFSLVIGCGLMALMFYSNRSGHDDAADPLRKRLPPTE